MRARGAAQRWGDQPGFWQQPRRTQRCNRHTGPLQTPASAPLLTSAASSAAASINSRAFAHCGFQLELSKFGEGSPNRALAARRGEHRGGTSHTPGSHRGWRHWGESRLQASAGGLCCHRGGCLCCHRGVWMVPRAPCSASPPHPQPRASQPAPHAACVCVHVSICATGILYSKHQQKAALHFVHGGSTFCLPAPCQLGQEHQQGCEQSWAGPGGYWFHWEMALGRAGLTPHRCWGAGGAALRQLRPWLLPEFPQVLEA